MSRLDSEQFWDSAQSSCCEEPRWEQLKLPDSCVLATKLLVSQQLAREEHDWLSGREKTPFTPVAGGGLC